MDSPCETCSDQSKTVKKQQGQTICILTYHNFTVPKITFSCLVPPPSFTFYVSNPILPTNSTQIKLMPNFIWFYDTCPLVQLFLSKLMVSAKFCTFISSMMVMTGWQKLAVILESWKRFLNFEFQTQSCLKSSTPTLRRGKKCPGLDAFPQPAEQTIEYGVFAKSIFQLLFPAGLDGRTVLLVNADKAEALAQLLPDIETDISIHEVLNGYQQIKSEMLFKMKFGSGTFGSIPSQQGRWLFNRLITGSHLCPLNEDVLPAAFVCYFRSAWLHLQNRLSDLDSHTFDWPGLSGNYP